MKCEVKDCGNDGIASLKANTALGEFTVHLCPEHFRFMASRPWNRLIYPQEEWDLYIKTLEGEENVL